MRITILAVAILAGTVSGQQVSYAQQTPQTLFQASYTYFGAQLQASCGSGVIFDVVGLPRIGQSFVVVTNWSCSCPNTVCLDAGQDAFVMTGASNTRIGSVPLPFDISLLTIPRSVLCGWLLTSAEHVSGPACGGGANAGVVKYTIPNSASLLGASFYQQALMVSWSSGYGRINVFTLSRGGHGVIGY